MHLLLNLKRVFGLRLTKYGHLPIGFSLLDNLRYISSNFARQTLLGRPCQAENLQSVSSHHQFLQQFCHWQHSSNSCSNNFHLHADIHLRHASSNIGDDKTKELPNQDNLQSIQSFMTEQVAKFFTSRHEYRIYTKDLVFENYWDLSQPYEVIGLTSYALKVLKVRIYLNFKYARLKVNVLSSSIHQDLGCVCVRWQVGGLPQHKAFMFWKYVPFRIRKTANKELEWLDGLSTFFISKQGFIYKHRIDRVMITVSVYHLF